MQRFDESVLRPTKFLINQGRALAHHFGELGFRTRGMSRHTTTTDTRLAETEGAYHSTCKLRPKSQFW